MMKLGGVWPTGWLLRWGHRSKVSQVRCGLVLVEFQNRYNTCRWGGLYTNAKHQGKWACGSKGSRMHTKLATAGLGRRLSAWVITIRGNNGQCFDERTGISLKCWNRDGCPSAPVGN